MLERLTPWVGAIAAPAFGLLLRASRRNRLLGRVRTYAQLADELDGRDPESAALLRGVVSQTVRQIVQTEQAALTRRLDPGSIVVSVLLASPALLGLVLVWPRDEWWRWPALVVSALWVLLVAVAGWQTVWKPHEDDDPHADRALAS